MKKKNRHSHARRTPRHFPPLPHALHLPLAVRLRLALHVVVIVGPAPRPDEEGRAEQRGGRGADLVDLGDGLREGRRVDEDGLVEPAFLARSEGLAWWVLLFSFSGCLFFFLGWAIGWEPGREWGVLPGLSGGHGGCLGVCNWGWWKVVGGCDGLDVKWSFLDWPVVIGGTRTATNY